MERSVEEWCDVEEDGGGVPLAQSRHAHRQRREEQEQRVGQRQRPQAVAEHLPHLKDEGSKSTRERELFYTHIRFVAPFISFSKR